MEIKEEIKKREQEEKDLQRQFIVFKLANEEYAIPIEDVKEVTHTPLISKMPKSPSFIKGVANIRGEIIAVLDLEERFKLKTGINLPSGKKSSYTMVIDADTYYIGILTRQVPHTLLLKKSEIDKAAHVIKKANIQKEFIDGLGKSNGNLIIILNIHKLLNDKEISFLTNVKTERDE